MRLTSAGGIMPDASQPAGGKRGKDLDHGDQRTGAIHVPPGEGQMLWVMDDLLTFKISGEDAQGAFTLAEEVIPSPIEEDHVFMPPSATSGSACANE
jgi:hypothetical protein